MMTVPYERHRLRVVTRAPFLIGFAALLVGLALVAAASRQDPANRLVLAAAGLVGCGGVLLGMSVMVWRRLGLADVDRVRSYLGWGVVSGAVALALALAVELGAKHVPGIGSETGVLFLAGPIEESAKLAMPVFLALRVGGRFAAPRAGFVMVFVSGVVFGVVEGVEYVAKPIPVPTNDSRVIAEVSESAMHAFTLLERSAVELMHPWLAASVAAVAWLCLARVGTMATKAAALAFLAAVAAHSINDGVFAGLLSRHPSVGLVLSWAGLVVIYVVLFRRHARELVPEHLVAANPPRWRPRERSRTGDPTLQGNPARPHTPS